MVGVGWMLNDVRGCSQLSLPLRSKTWLSRAPELQLLPAGIRICTASVPPLNIPVHSALCITATWLCRKPISSSLLLQDTDGRRVRLTSIAPMRNTRAWLGAICLLATAGSSLASNYTTPNQLFLGDDYRAFDDCPKCPSCFNCNLDDKCTQFADCSPSNGKCKCPHGYGGDDCSEPLCGSLVDGDKRRPPPEGETCQCEDGWGGINCNVCERDDVCNALMPPDENGVKSGGVCYKEPMVVKENYQICKVTNQPILDQLDGQIPEVTFSCNADDETCNFQFWVDRRESFYCSLDHCSWEVEALENQNKTQYSCENCKCACIPGRMLCGQDGSINIDDFLEDYIRGPATFSSLKTTGGSTDDGSKFREPAMNDLIQQVFGDSSIFLDCDAGECLYKTEIPGYIKPVPKINTPLIAGVIGACALLVVIIGLLVWYLSRRSFSKYEPLGDESDDEATRLLNDTHRAATLQFENVSYNLNGKQILERVQGICRPGQVTAIMGASGAGKTTFLDILARKNKRGNVFGNFYINGEKVSDADFKSVTGFVDQEDTMLPTLTVHETIEVSAFLRLPRNMSRAAKSQRVHEVEKELGIYHIRDQLIGSEDGGNGRGVSGGERRRVAIACELVTSPSILFLDEPTSGLDAYNAYNVIECLLRLARRNERTVVFTIHQPRSNIVALFDSLILLAKGQTVYSGSFQGCQGYFDSIGYSCPPGFNIADYLVDLTMHAGSEDNINDGLDINPNRSHSIASSLRGVKSIPSASNVSAAASTTNLAATLDDTATPAKRPQGTRRESIKQKQDRKLFTRNHSIAGDSIKSATVPQENEAPNSEDTSAVNRHWLRINRSQGVPPPQILEADEDTAGYSSDLQYLVLSYEQSEVGQGINTEINENVRDAIQSNGASNGNGAATDEHTNGGPDGNAKGPVIRGYKRVGYLRQFMVVSSRTWKNLYRNPMLMLSHYAISIVVAVLCGYLFYGLSGDLKGFQDRLGLLFFLLALLGFGSLTSLPAFAGERLLFIRERANGYYSPFIYFASKVIFDLVPLRLLPPIILAAIVYPMTGLTPEGGKFGIFVLVLVLFNLAAAVICLFIGVLCRDGGVANLVGSLVMLFSLLFAGFLKNYEAMPAFAQFLQKASQIR